MEKLTIFEDKNKLRRSVPVLIILGILAIIAGLCIYIYLIQGAIGGGLCGMFLGMGIYAAGTGFKRWNLLYKPARIVVDIDEIGVKVTMNVYLNAYKLFIWQDIQSANAKKNVFLLILKNPDNYISTLCDKKEINIAKTNIKNHMTPIIVDISTCKESAGEIAERINIILQAISTPVI